jgi:hypothetical protein
VRRQTGQCEFALPQGLPHQAEVHLLEIAQPPVHELARPRGGARRIVTLLDQGDRQPAGRGIESRPRTGDSAPDDEDVELAVRETAPRVRTVAEIERDSLRHTAIVPVK